MSSYLINQTHGVMPVIFHIASWPVPTYTFFISLGFLTGFIVYYHEVKKANIKGEFPFLIAIGAFTGSALGAKLLELMINIDKIGSTNELVYFIFSGRTIIGGLIGGAIGVWITKRFMHMKTRRGNLFAPAIASGVAIGRFGCFFNGCCYGKPTSLPWGVNFGDGLYRHPTMLYESIFMACMFIVIKIIQKKYIPPPGALFSFLMIAYFIFRFLIEYIRVERTAFIGFTWFQIISLLVLGWLVFSEKELILKQINRYGRPS